MMEIAVYGKGGIGKSTISANLSAALAMRGEHVLQIGCDPKHDSTRLLVHGRPQTTVLDYLRGVSREEEDPSKVLETGYQNIGCIEAGGPNPGVGCAGRGIITSFEFLDRHHIKQDYDIVLYDVLGDVVCGGFAVPVRREYADVIFLVTSGEYMALYAANNILRGIRNFDGSEHRRVAGIIYNERKLADEEERVRRFAEAVSLPVVAKVPRSHAFAHAEQENMTLMELEGYPEEKEVFRTLAAAVSPEMQLYEALPLTDEELEAAVLQNRITRKDGQSKKESAAASALERREEAPSEEAIVESRDARGLNRPPLYGCAFNGAAILAAQLHDAIVIAHAPRACAFYTLQSITSPGRRNLFNRGILMPSSLSPHFVSTDIGQAEAVFGGMDLLKEAVTKALERKPGAVVVVSSCVSGIIGDDIRQVESMGTDETPVITISADGDISGDYMEGIRQCLHTVAERLIDPKKEPSVRKVNLINEAGIADNGALNYRIVKDLLEQMDVGINCRFLYDTNTEDVRRFLEAPVNILATESEDSLNLRNWLMEKYHCRFMDGALPVGFRASSEWIRQMAEIFDRKTVGEEIIQHEHERYRKEIEALRPALEGKTIVMTTINVNLDWLLEAAVDVGMKLKWIGVINYLHQTFNVTSHRDYCDHIEEDIEWTTIQERIGQYDPDLVLTYYTSPAKDGKYVQDALPMTPVAGFHSALYILKRWVRLFEDKNEGEWQYDRELFDKYYS